MPSVKQTNYILALLTKAGFGTRYMDRRFKELGATMRERSGKVETWVNSKNSQEASDLIETLKAMIAEKSDEAQNT